MKLSDIINNTVSVETVKPVIAGSPLVEPPKPILLSSLSSVLDTVDSLETNSGDTVKITNVDYHGMATGYKDLPLDSLLTIDKSKVIDSETGDNIPNWNALSVKQPSGKKKYINKVSNNYPIIQPKSAVQLFQKNTSLEITGVMQNYHTGGLIIQAQYNIDNFAGEEHIVNLVFYTSHNSSFATLLTLNMIRCQCFNAIPGLIGQKQRHLIKAKHTSAFNFDQMESYIDLIPKRIAAFRNQYENLKDVKYSEEQFLNDFVEFFKITETDKNKDKKISEIKGIYHSARGQSVITNDSGYKAFQAITYMHTHKGKKTCNDMENRTINNVNASADFFDLIMTNAA